MHVPRRTTGFVSSAALLALAWLAGVPAPTTAARAGQPDATTSTRAGAYTDSQADRGERVYARRCGLCHQPQEYTGETFMKSWSGQTTDALFDLLRTTMPQDNPGSLKNQEYADLIAFLLRLNGLPPGDRELKGTAGALKLIVIEAPEEPGRPHARRPPIGLPLAPAAR